MSTRSTISIEKPNNEIHCIYCHYDGYPTGNGKILLDHYKDLKKIKKLINKGDLSSLASTLEETRSYNEWRGEDKNINIYNSREEMLSKKGQEYNYLWSEKDNFWWMNEEFEEHWIPLDQIIF